MPALPADYDLEAVWPAIEGYKQESIDPKAAEWLAAILAEQIDVEQGVLVQTIHATFDKALYRVLSRHGVDVSRLLITVTIRVSNTESVKIDPFENVWDRVVGSRRGKNSLRKFLKGAIIRTLDRHLNGPGLSGRHDYIMAVARSLDLQIANILVDERIIRANPESLQVECALR